VLILLAKRGAIRSLVIPPLHTVEHVADVEDIRAERLGLLEVTILEFAICSHGIMVRVGSEKKPDRVFVVFVVVIHI
jgi:hypothetical protein